MLALCLLLATLPSPAAQGAPVVSIAPASMLQFVSGGHALGFSTDGMYAAAGTHALHVNFVKANNVQPQTDSAVSADSQTAPLSRVTYASLWDGVTLAYATSADSIYITTYTLAPGADVNHIRLRYNAPITVNEDGTLSIAFETGALTESAPAAW